MRESDRLNSRRRGVVQGAGLVAAGALVVSSGLWLARYRSRSFRLRDKNVVITGGSRGLGFALARRFLQRGANVALLARDGEALEAAKEKLGGVRVHTAVCDVTDEGQVSETIDRLQRAMGGIHVLVNNAGMIAVGPAQEATLADFRRSLDVHLWGPLYASLAVLPEMRRRRQGRIVNISSIGGKISVPHLLPYSVGKFALGGLSEGLAADARRDNVRVTTVYPGLMRTGSPRHAWFKGKHRAEFAWFRISASLPGLSIGVERAARQIVRACEAGDARLVVSFPAKLAVRLHEVFPEFSSAVLGAANRLLPNAGGIGSRSAQGSASASGISSSWLTALDQLAARRNNQIA